MLQAIGLDNAQERVYRALLTRGTSDGPTLADRLSLSERAVVRALHRLEQSGLVKAAGEQRTEWAVLPPRVAIGALLARHRLDLEKVELEAGRLGEEFRAFAVDPTLQEAVELVVGVESVAERFRQLQLGARSEVCALVTDEPMAVSGEDNRAEEESTARGVRYQVVVERQALARPGTLTELRRALDRGEEVRTVDVLPTKLVIADGAVAMAPFDARERRPAAFVVHAGGLLDSLNGLFASVWHQAVPLRLTGDGGPETAEGGEPDDVDRSILSLLLAGHSDTSISKLLDIGLRTLQRRVSRMMHLAGASTRYQLGWQVSERGWLTRDTGTRTHTHH
ncbi:helix-turn-helix domain-containing protein [Streptomyces sp. NPDC051453]|uniref:helix-turn-helix domain-containing protein n=1 Tax=Streptomyces sp. NPDC051453 TaxID=3154941 RepID=UPI00343DAC32